MEPKEKETNILQKVRLAARHISARLLRNNVGIAWQGKVRKNRDGSITIFEPRIVRFGLAVGSSDLVGAKRIKITQDMVGTFIAQAMVVEVKRPGKNPTSEQQTFLDAAEKFGCIAIVARSEDDLIGMAGI